MSYQQTFAAGLGQRKVAIPRLQRPGSGQNAIKDRRRVPRACTACRSHKIKCTGERPHCKHCATTNRECVYILPRKDRLKIVTERCQQMAFLLKGLRSGVCAEDDARIGDLLEAVEEDADFQQTTPSIPDNDANGSSESQDVSTWDQRHELDVGSLDLLDEDLHINDRARSTGFVGRNSEVQWLRAVAMAHSERTEEDSGRGQRKGSYASGIGCEQVSSYSFWSDNESVDVDFFVDPYELPPLETAEHLLECYMSKVHDSFPILPIKIFEDQFRKYFAARLNGNAPRLSPKWQAILNLVLGIGAKYSHLSKAKFRADNRDHIIYQARARALSLNDTMITSHPDLPQIQSLGLLAFYWLSIGQVSRAWTVIGLAIRFAYTLGLHVRNEDPSATAAKRETLVRTWWSLYSLERTLSVITGRPSIIIDSCCSVPLPLPVAEDQVSNEVEPVHQMRKGSSTSFGFTSQSWSNGSTESLRTPIGFGIMEASSKSYFNASIQLSIITQSILISLYSASTMVKSAEENHQEMVQLSQRLDQWIMSLPAEFDFQTPNNRGRTSLSRERTLLAFQFYSARMLLGRPCLSARRQSWREDSEASFARRMANGCIEAAKAVVDSIPNDSNTLFIYDQGPWWCIVHHLMQALSVLLLGLSHPSSTTQDSMLLIGYAKRVIRWLQMMQDPVSERAYSVAANSFEIVARRYPVDLSDMWGIESPQERHAQQMTFDHSMPGFLPPNFVPQHPHDMAMATYAGHDAISTGTTCSSYSAMPVFNDVYFNMRG